MPEGPRAPLRRLGELSAGESGCVHRLRCGRVVARRLMEMGLLPGTLVALKRVAPLGDPVELRLRGYALSIRRSEADLIEIETAMPDRSGAA